MTVLPENVTIPGPPAQWEQLTTTVAYNNSMSMHPCITFEDLTTSPARCARTGIQRRASAETRLSGRVKIFNSLQVSEQKRRR